MLVRDMCRLTFRRMVDALYCGFVSNHRSLLPADMRLCRCRTAAVPPLIAHRTAPVPPPVPQFLESYKSVTLASMAASFGVGPDFLDAELVRLVVVAGGVARCLVEGQLCRHPLHDPLPV